ncbi:MAG: hypothetical protein RJQ04_04490 [Longimicrobiales bacterium]
MTWTSTPRPPSGGRALPSAASPALALALVLLTGTAAEAQLCQEAPLRRNEAGLVALVDGGGPSVQKGGLVAVNALDRVGVTFGAAFGGRPATGTVEEARVRIEGGLRAGPVRVCPWAGARSRSFAFRDDFSVDRGRVSDQAWSAGLAVASPDVPLGPARLRLVAWAGSTYRTFEMTGRRLVITDEVGVEEVTRRDHSYHLEGAALASVRWGRLGLTGGIGNRPRPGPDRLWFVQATLVALDLD